ncbi:four and a half LIM domains protein 2-like isoform X2 [Watersipora subatra]
MSSTCNSCRDSLMGKRYVIREEKATCLKCYETKFANKCHTCKRAISTESKDLTYKDQHYHESCFLCSSCHTTLANTQFLNRGGSLVCEACYNSNFAEQCDLCTKIFKHDMEKVEYNGKKYHTTCFTCMNCKKPIGDKSFMPRDNKFMCMNCYNENCAAKCGSCSKIITNSALKFEGALFHKECFVCKSCETMLAGSKFTTQDGKPYCQSCYVDLFSKKCELCVKPISGLGTTTKYISYEGQQWHSQCFQCSQCTKNLVGEGFLLKNSKIMCGKCGC